MLAITIPRWMRWRFAEVFLSNASSCGWLWTQTPVRGTPHASAHWRVPQPAACRAEARLCPLTAVQAGPQERTAARGRAGLILKSHLALFVALWRCQSCWPGPASGPLHLDAQKGGKMHLSIAEVCLSNAARCVAFCPNADLGHFTCQSTLESGLQHCSPAGGLSRRGTTLSLDGCCSWAHKRLGSALCS